MTSSQTAIGWAQDAASTDNGKRLYARNGCYECHGYAAQEGTGPRLAPRPMPAAAMAAYILKPVQMPPYTAKVMSDRDVADVRAYLATIPEPPPVKSIPLLNP